MKKILSSIGVILLLFAVSMFISGSAQAQNPFKTTGVSWYSYAQSVVSGGGTPKTFLASGDTAYSTSVAWQPYDSTSLNVYCIKGDTAGCYIRFQYGNATANGQSWSALQTGNVGTDTLGYTTASGDYSGLAFRITVPATPKGNLIRFVAIATAANGRLNGTTAEKWITSAQSIIIQRIKQ